MFKKLTLWFFFTVFAGLLPLLFVVVVCNMTGKDLSYSMFGTEIFFFNLMIAADGMKELYELNGHKKVKVFLFASMLFTIIIVASLYGILLLNDYSTGLNLQLDFTYSLSKILTVSCLLISFSIQIMGGAEYADGYH